jgi:hypothetical protein
MPHFATTLLHVSPFSSVRLLEPIVVPMSYRDVVPTSYLCACRPYPMRGDAVCIVLPPCCVESTSRPHASRLPICISLVARYLTDRDCVDLPAAGSSVLTTHRRLDGRTATQHLSHVCAAALHTSLIMPSHVFVRIHHLVIGTPVPDRYASCVPSVVHTDSPTHIPALSHTHTHSHTLTHTHTHFITLESHPAHVC